MTNEPNTPDAQPQPENWYFTTNPDAPWRRGGFKSRTDAINAADKELELGRMFWVGRLKVYDPITPSGDCIIDELANAACDNPEDSGGECSADWLSHVRDADGSLEKAVREAILAWLERTGNMPDFGSIVDVEPRRQGENQ